VPRVVQSGSGREQGGDATRTAESGSTDAPIEAVPRAVGPDDPTRTSTRNPSDASPAPIAGHPPMERLPAPLQYRDPDRYQIVAEHGRGGLGRVYRARDKELGRDVALKELLHRGSTGELRFFREALITARLEHPGIVPVHEAGRWPDGTPFYAMKLVAGRPLKELIEECKTLEDRLALLPNIIAVADAIAYAHDRKIIHRDLKPSNVIVGEFGETVVIDWGLAKDIQAGPDDPAGDDGPYRAPADDGVTVAGTVVGTPAYMSPEQARGEPVDERTDVYAIGAMLYQLATAERHWDLTQREQLLRLKRVGIDSDLVNIITKTLCPERGRRYKSARDLAQDLRAFVSGLRLSSRSYSLIEVVAHWIRRNKKRAASGVLLVSIAAAFAMWSIRSVIRQRDRAEAASIREARAHGLAVEQRNRSFLAQAQVTLASDPTAAFELLKGNAKSLDTAYIVARAVGAGVAASSFTSDSPLQSIRAQAGLAAIFFTTLDRKLWRFEPQSGANSLLATNLPEPSPIGANGRQWLFVEKVQGKHVLRSFDASIGVTLPTPARVIVANELVVMALLLDDTLVRLDPGRGVSEVVANVSAAIALETGEVVACTRDGVLFAGSALETPSASGSCEPRLSVGSLVGKGSNSIVPRTSSRFEVTRDGVSKEYSLPSGRALHYAAISTTGVVGLIDANGIGYYMIAGSDDVYWAFPGDSRALVVTAEEGWIAWGYRDGRVMILDTSTGRTWAYQAHKGSVWHVFLDPQSLRMITADEHSIRLWNLTTTSPMPVATSACVAFNIATSPTDPTQVATDCSSGHMQLVDVAAHTTTLPHRHRRVAFGVAWLRDAACTASWDGAVLCTDRRSQQTRTLTQKNTPIRWIVGDGRRLAYVTEDGGVWTYDDAAGELLITTLDDEPYRVSFHPGNQLVITTQSGKTLFVDVNNGTLGATSRASELASGIALSEDGGVFVASLDGTVNHWKNGVQTRTFSARGPVRQVRAIDKGFVASVSYRRLWVECSVMSLEFDLHAKIEALAASAGSVAVGLDTGEVVVLRPGTSELAVLPLFDGSVTAISPLVDRSFVVATSTGSIYVVDASILEYVPFMQESELKENEED